MSRLLTTILLLGLALTLTGQPKRMFAQDYARMIPGRYYHNAVSVFTNDSNWGTGIRIDHREYWYGFYAAASYGKFNPMNMYNIKSEHKYSIGIMISERRPTVNWWPMITLGVNYNTYDYYDGFAKQDHVPATQRISFDAGVTGQIKRFAPFATYDFIKYQLMIGFGFMFDI